MIGTDEAGPLRPRPRWRGLLPLLLAALALRCAAAEPETIRVGALQFGAVAWTLDTMQRQGYDRARGIRIEAVPMAASNAAQIALQGGSVDVIQSDWLWAARNRADGRAYQYAPSSTSLGALYVKPDSGIASLADLKGKEFGVAGTSVDKSWLLLQAYARKNGGLNLAKDAKPSFAPPPALNELLLRGKLAAVLNYWPYGARLHAAGMKTLVDMREVMDDLGAAHGAPMVGWVFTETYAKEHRAALLAFVAAVAETNDYLRSNDAEWQKLKPLMKADTEADFLALRDAYRAGVDSAELRVDLVVLRKLYALLVEEGGEALVGKARTLDEGLFFAAPEFSSTGAGSRP